MRVLKWIVGIVLIVVVIVGFVGYDRITTVIDTSDCDYQNLREVLAIRDSRNIGLGIKICKDDETLTIDMISIEGDKTRTDVFRYILQTADELKRERFSRVEFAHKGDSKFFITGAYFKKLGEEYEWQNAIYTSRTFTENVKNLDGTAAFGSSFGEAFDQQMGDHNEFHDQWYVNELMGY